MVEVMKFALRLMLLVETKDLLINGGAYYVPHTLEEEQAQGGRLESSGSGSGSSLFGLPQEMPPVRPPSLPAL